MLAPDLCAVLGLLGIAVAWIWTGRREGLGLPRDFQTPTRRRRLRQLQRR